MLEKADIFTTKIKTLITLVPLNVPMTKIGWTHEKDTDKGGGQDGEDSANGNRLLSIF